MDIIRSLKGMRRTLKQEQVADQTLSQRYPDRHNFDGLGVWVCAGKAHEELFMFLPTSKDGEDVDNCPSCGDNVFESYDLFPLWLTDKDPYEPNA